MEGNIWQTWIESKSREDRCVLGRAAEKRSRYKTGWEETEPTRHHLYIWISGAVCGDGGTETEIRRRIQAGASAWRKVEGVMGDRHISRKLKGKLLRSCISLPIRPRDLVDKQRMEELGEEVGVRESLTRKLMRSRLMWAGHVERMEGERLTKRTDALRVEKRKTEADIKQDLTRLPSQITSSRWQVDKEAIGLSRVQQFSHLCVARPYQISVNSIFKHIHTTSINTIIW